jgi:hypothetical protein
MATATSLLPVAWQAVPLHRVTQGFFGSRADEISFL